MINDDGENEGDENNGWHFLPEKPRKSEQIDFYVNHELHIAGWYTREEEWRDNSGRKFQESSISKWRKYEPNDK